MDQKLLAIGHLLALCRSIVEGTVTLREGKWVKEELMGTEVYGIWVAALYGTTADNKFQFVVNQNYSPKTNTSAASWSLNTEYIVEMEVTAYASNTRKLNIDLSVKLASDGSVVWQLSDWCDESLSGT